MGKILFLQITPPAAGAEFDTGVIKTGFKLIALFLTYTADANVATRKLMYDCKRSSTVIWRRDTTLTVTAGVASDLRSNNQGTIAGINQNNNTEPGYFPTGSRLTSAIENIQAGDTMSNIYAIVEYDD